AVIALQRQDVDQVAGGERVGNVIVAEDAGEVEVVAQPGDGVAAHSAERVDGERGVVAATVANDVAEGKTAPGNGLGQPGLCGDEVAQHDGGVMVSGTSQAALAGLGVGISPDGAGEVAVAVVTSVGVSEVAAGIGGVIAAVKPSEG